LQDTLREYPHEHTEGYNTGHYIHVFVQLKASLLVTKDGYGVVVVVVDSGCSAITTHLPFKSTLM
jgi:hypothetical protein